MQQAEAYYQPDIISQTYIPRGQNVLQKIFKDHFEEFKTQYDEKYAKTYGNYRIERITEKSLILTNTDITIVTIQKNSKGQKRKISYEKLDIKNYEDEMLLFIS